MAGFRVFERRIRRRANRITAKTTLYRKKIINEVHAELVRRTPVDTGLARSNWQVTIKVPASGTVPIDTITGTLTKGKKALFGAKSGDLIYITNNVVYIIYLNQGSSGQAPAGYVQAAVRTGRLKAGDPKLLD